MLRITTILLIVLLVNNTFAQKTYQKIFSLPHTGTSGEGTCIINTSDGGFAFCSRYAGLEAGQPLFAKFDNKGNKQWSKAMPYESGVSICQNVDSSYIIVGGKKIAKFDKHGNIAWSKIFSSGEFQSVAATSDSCFIVTDYASIAKMDADGNIIWSKTYNSDNDHIRSFWQIVEADDKNYFLLGETTEGGCLIRIDKNGHRLWSKNIIPESNFSITVRALCKTSDGGLAFGGSVSDHIFSHTNLYVTKLDSNYLTQWSKAFGTNQWENLTSVAGTSDTGVIVTGYTNNAALVSKMNQTGQLKWTRMLGNDTKADDVFNSVIENEKNGFLLLGFTQSYPHYQTEAIWLTNISNDGYVCGGFDSAKLIEDFSQQITYFTYKESDVPKIADTTHLDVYDFADIVTICEDVVLPLNLLSLTAFNKNGQNTVNWSTQEELNTKSFEVQRSVDGINFYKIGFVTAKNNFKNDYNFIDKNPNTGSNYYRLKITDNAGNFYFSDIVEVKNLETFLVSILPNPVKGNSATIKISGQSSETINLFIINADGKLLQSKKMNIQPGTLFETIDISNLSKGVYYLKIVSDKQEKVLKFVKG